MIVFGEELTLKTWRDWFERCPFGCDGTATIMDWSNIRGNRTEYYMRCNKCGAVGPSRDSEEGAKEVWGEVVLKVATLADAKNKHLMP